MSQSSTGSPLPGHTGRIARPQFRLLDSSRPWELRMNLPDHELIEEHYMLNLANGQNRKTQERYRDHLIHFSAYLGSVRQRDFYTAARKDVLMFMGHLMAPGGANPDATRLGCRWCRERGYPDGRGGPGWSASYRKSYLSAIRSLYRHFKMEEDLPDIDPSAYVVSPRVIVRRGYTPTREEVTRFLDVPGSPPSRLLAHWMFYAPSRRATFADTLWKHIDFDSATWEVVGKGDKVDVWDLHPILLREFRVYRRWQEGVARHNRRVREALAVEETAYVLLSSAGRPKRPESIAKMVKWRAIRADVGVLPANGRWDAPGGKTSKLSPHALRRAWAHFALNDPEHPQSLDVIQEVLKHSDISTTRRHYAPTKPERATAALRGMNL
jgi:integrase